jgi:hypothetical protein
MPEVSSKVISKLNALRRSISAWMFVRGAAVLLVVIVALLALSLWLDWTWMLDKQQRVICIVIALVLLAFLIYRHLMKPLAQRMDVDTLALQVEQKHHEMHEGLITALQFSRIKDPRDLGMSPAMVEATIAAGNDAAERTDFRDVLDRKSFTRNLIIAGVMLVVLGAAAVGVASTTTLNIWFSRMFLLDDARYPRKTNFDIKLNEKGELVLPRGDDWEYLVRVFGEVPDSVYIDFNPKTGSDVTQLMARQGDAVDGATEAQFASAFKNIIEEFSFRIRGGDNRTEWIPVRLVDRPTIETFDLTLEHPQYTAREPQVVMSIRPSKVTADDEHKEGPRKEGKGGTSSLSPLKGSSLRFTAQTNKPVAQAKLKWEKGSMPLALEPTTVKDQDGNDKAATRFTATLSPEQLTSATYAIDLTDTEGLDSKKPTRFIVRLRADKDPTVKATLLGIGSMVVPEARIPIESTFRDDYAVTAAGLNYQFKGESEEAAKGGQRVGFTDVKFSEKDVTDKGFTHRHNWELAGLKLPVGSNLTFFVDASDNDTISGPKIGKSTAFFVRIVEAKELRDELTRRQAEQRQEFERLIKVQDDLIAETRIVMATGGTQSNLSPALRQSLMQSQKRQKLGADRCKAIAKQHENLFLEYINNKLESEDGEVLTKMNRSVIRPLYNIGDKSAILATDLLDAARKAPDGATREKVLQNAIEQQMAVAAEMREVLKYMEKWSNYQEAVNIIYEIMRDQTGAKQATVDALAKMREGIFGKDKPAPPVPGPGPAPTKDGK